MEIERPREAHLQTKFARLEKHEPMAFDAAAEVTEKQLRLALAMVDSVLASDPRRTDGALLAGVMSAFATNFAAITISRAELEETSSNRP
jgi:hypothetical protein